MRNTPPCYNCEKRYLGCHDYCDKYQEFRQNRNKLLNEQRKRTKIECDYYYYVRDAIKRMSR
jgi:hypothetical protein